MIKHVHRKEAGMNWLESQYIFARLWAWGRPTKLRQISYLFWSLAFLFISPVRAIIVDALLDTATRGKND